MKPKELIGLLIFIVFIFYPLMFSQNDYSKLNLMPVPRKVELTAGKFRLDSSFTVKIGGRPAARLFSAACRMLRRLSGRTGLFFMQNYIIPDVKVNNPSMIIYAEKPGRVKLFDDESCSLEINPDKIKLSAKTDIGALRGIETLLQLLCSDKKGYYFPDVIITDYPRFPWRGLMIDAARHFMPVNVIKRNLDGMAAVKLNVLHLHLSDDQGFRIECKTFPKLTDLGSDGLFYTQAQIKDIIRYANDRGIRVVPEFDLPGHATSWFAGYPQYASAPGPYRIERKWGEFDPTFDPTNPGTYKFLEKFFKEMSGLFPDEFMHIGGDENNGKQWDSNLEIQKFMKVHKIKDNHALQNYFNSRLLKILTEYNKKMTGWDEILHHGMPKNIVIQSWRGIESLKNAVTKGYNVLLSNGYYLDLNHSAEYHYSIDPDPDSLGITEDQKKLILGGEAAMWSEYVSPENIDSRIWPRTAAVAERFWSDKNVRNVKDMYGRLAIISDELEGLGLMHIKNPGMMIRRLAGYGDVKALTNFISVVEPVKDYNREAQRKDYTSYSPLTRVVDAAVPDAGSARNFRNLVKDFLNNVPADTAAIKLIKQHLNLWKNNNTLLEKTIARSPILREIKPLSEELAEISSIGLKALNYIIKNEKADANWINGSLLKIKKASEPAGEVELTIISPITELVKRSGDVKVDTIFH